MANFHQSAIHKVLSLGGHDGCRRGLHNELTPVIFKLCYEVGDGELESEEEGPLMLGSAN